ncbi:MAG: HAD family hydrolase [Pseudomonadota bacterium]
MPTRIKAALFDKDGTLIDFTASWRGLVDHMIAVYAKDDRDLADALGAAIGYDRATGVFLPGSPIVADTTDVVAHLMAELLPGRSPAEIEDDANRRAAAAGAGDGSGVAPVAGLREAMEALDAMGVALGVGTHDSEAAARIQAKGMGVDHLIRFYAGYDSGHGLKPGPGMPIAFARASGVDPAEIVMVGDSVHDLCAGRAAGCAASIGVLTGPATERELEAEADAILPSVADLPDYLRRVFPA